MRNHFEQLIERLAETCGATTEKTNEGLDISVVFGDFLVMFSYLDDAEEVLLTTSVADLPQENREAVLLSLLQGQYFFRDTVGATLAVDTEGRFVTLQLARHLTLLSEANFSTLVENYLNVAKAWRERLEAAAGEGREAPHQDDAAPDPTLEMAMLRV